MSELSIILVNYKRAQDTIECVHSFEKSTFTNYDVIIVDNGSNDGSIDELVTHCVHATIIPAGVNMGFAEGNNVGIREALRRGSRQILLLNNDTIIQPDTLGALSEVLSTSPNVGIVGAKIYYHDRPNILWFAGGYFNVNSAFYGHHGIGKEDVGQFDNMKDCDYVTGCCLLFRREVAESVGLLESAYFAYLEDADFCIRARRASYRVVYQPRATLYHKVSTTSTWDSPAYIYFNLRNKLIFLERHSTFSRRLPHIPRLIYFYTRQFIRLIVKWHDMTKTRAAWYGLVDGLRSYTGAHGEGRMTEISR